MMQYVNGFSGAMDIEKGEVILTLLQQIPQIGEDGNVIGVQVEEVNKIVMGNVVAKNLMESIQEMLSDDK